MLNWNWKDKIGEWTIKQGENVFKLNIYKCNGLAVILDEDEKTYRMYGFFTNENHLKNCLGLTKEYKHNIYRDELIKVEFIDCKTSRTILKHLVKASFTNDIEIKIFQKPPF